MSTLKKRRMKSRPVKVSLRDSTGGLTSIRCTKMLTVHIESDYRGRYRSPGELLGKKG